MEGGRRITKGEQTREKILERSIRIFAKQGFDAASFQQIADSCGLSQAAVFYHFADKTELVSGALSMIVEHNHSRVAGLMDPHDDAYVSLMKHMEGNLRWGLESPDEAQVLLLIYYLACFNPRFTRAYGEMLATARGRVLRHILAGMREGLFRPATSPEAAAETIHDAMVGAFIHALTEQADKPQPVQSRLKHAASKWRPLVHSVLGYRGVLRRRAASPA